MTWPEIGTHASDTERHEATPRSGRERMMQNKSVDQAGGEQVDRTTARLRKLAALQGFVTEAQIEEVAADFRRTRPGPENIEVENIRINSFVKGEGSPVYERRLRRMIVSAPAAPVRRSDLGVPEYGRQGAAAVPRRRARIRDADGVCAGEAVRHGVPFTARPRKPLPHRR